MWASAAQVYNELASQRPEVIKVLSEGNWPCRRYVSKIKKDPTAKGPPFKPHLLLRCTITNTSISNGVQNNTMFRPILYPSCSSRPPLMLFSRRNLTGCYQAQRSASEPKLSTRQIDALDAIHFAAKKHAFSIPQRKGDLILLNNMAVLHARENFRADGVTAPVSSDRHLLRLWLRDKRRGIHVPEQLRHIWEIVYGEASVEKGIWDMEGRHSHSTILNESDASTVG